MSLRLSMLCSRYDRNQALLDGSVRPEGIDLDIHVMTDDRTRHQRSRTGEFDVAEFFAGTYIADVEPKLLGYTAIPIFVKRMFRHSYIYVNRRSGIRDPRDLNGRRVGIQHWFTTTALWAKGILAEEHEVDLSSITWVAERAIQEQWTPPSWLKLEQIPSGSTQEGLLFDGSLDACITTETWAPGVHPDVDFLFPDYAERERSYYERTGFFPIMHVLAIKSSVLEAEPWVAMSLYNAWQEAKERCYDWLDWQRVHQTSLWYRALWEEERAFVGSRDIYPWGFQKCRAEVDKLLEYSYDQTLTARKLEPEELFHPSTLST